ncbi:hypothetical protein ES332_A10G280500v1 [Gossypium tomentosum]|uniref:Uncharacterized protein n=1 Tax=Gossypium tomentosum TaxID=34277 RepID=A0A5D2NVQ6_GOSTO|nr:hypothetical protein ES332_A10G280500v1 [Gossypium tomentosum]
MMKFRIWHSCYLFQNSWNEDMELEVILNGNPLTVLILKMDSRAYIYPMEEHNKNTRKKKVRTLK